MFTKVSKRKSMQQNLARVLSIAGIYVCLVLFIPSTLQSQPCLPEGITFTTQAQIDNFQILYPNCTEIEGSLTIEGIDITNLLGLNVITNVQGTFYVLWDSLLTSLEGLENLSFIGGSLDINGTVLYSLTGLNSLTYIGESLRVLGGDSIASLSGIENLEYIGGSIIFSYCNSLTTLTGLPFMDTIYGSLQLLNMYGLTNLAGLDSLKYIQANSL